MTVQRPSAAELIDACKTLGIGLAVTPEGTLLIGKAAPPETRAFLLRHRKSITKRILAARRAS